MRRALVRPLALALAVSVALSASAVGLAWHIEAVRAAERAEGYHSAWSTQSDYIVSVSGKETNFSVGVLNTGWAGWYRGREGATANLGTNDPTDTLIYSDWATSKWTGANRLATQSTEYVGPGQTAWFETSFKVPYGAEAGVYQFKVRPVIEDTKWLEDSGIFHLIFVPFSSNQKVLTNGIHVWGQATTQWQGSGTISFTGLNDANHPVLVSFTTDANGYYNVFLPFDTNPSVGPCPQAPGSSTAPSATPAPTPSPAASATPTGSATPVGSATPAPTGSATPAPTSSATPAPTGSATPAPTGSPTLTPLPSPTTPPAATSTPCPISTLGAVVSSSTVKPAAAVAGLAVPAPSATARASGSPKARALATPTPTPTPAPTAVPSATITPTPAPVVTPAPSQGPTSISKAVTPPGILLQRDGYHVSVTMIGLKSDADGRVPVPDAIAPKSRASAPTTAKATFNINADYSDVGSGVATIQLWSKEPGSSTFRKADQISVAASKRSWGTTSFTYTPTIGAGVYEFYTIATDIEGIVQAPPTGADTSTKFDNSIPTSTASGPAGSNATTFAVTSAYNDTGTGVASVAMYVKAPSATAYTLVSSKPLSPTSLSGTLDWSFAPALPLVEGAYSFYSLATDGAGNTQATPSSPHAIVNVDVTPPTSVPVGPTSPSSIAVWPLVTTVTDNVGLANVELWVKKPGDVAYSVGATQTVSGTSTTTTFNYTPISDGTYFFYTVAVDSGSNREVTPTAADITLVADRSKPTAVASTLAPTTAVSPFSISVAYTDTTTGVTSVDLYVKRPGDAAYAIGLTNTITSNTFSGTTNFTYIGSLGEGSYSFFARATDGAANQTDIPASPQITILYDGTRPVATVTGGVTTPTKTLSWSMVASVTDNVGLASVALYVKAPGAASYGLVDTKPASGTSSPTTFAAYAPIAGDGDYNFYALATDGAGNVQIAPAVAQYVVRFDTSLPTSTASSAANVTTIPIAVSSVYSDVTSGAITVDLYVRTPGAGSFVLASTQSFAASTSGVRNFSYTPAAGAGVYDFYSVATDAAGNIQTTPAGAQTSTTWAP